MVPLKQSLALMTTATLVGLCSLAGGLQPGGPVCAMRRRTTCNTGRPSRGGGSASTSRAPLPNEIRKCPKPPPSTVLTLEARDMFKVSTMGGGRGSGRNASRAVGVNSMNSRSAAALCKARGIRKGTAGGGLQDGSRKKKRMLRCKVCAVCW